MLSVLDIEKYLKGDESQIGGFDILYKDGLRYAPQENAEWTSFIGCANNRDKQLRRLAKARVVESSAAAEAMANVKNRGAIPEFFPDVKGGVDLRGGGRKGEQRVCRVYPVGGG